MLCVSFFVLLLFVYYIIRISDDLKVTGACGSHDDDKSACQGMLSCKTVKPVDIHQIGLDNKCKSLAPVSKKT